MSTGEGGGSGNGQKPPQEQQRRRTPPPRQRTPPPRTRSGNSEGSGSNGGDVEHRTVADERRRSSIWGRVFGREGLNEALEERLNPYEYQSTRPVLRWLFIALILFIAVSSYELYTDFQLRNTLGDWQSEGITEIPPSSNDATGALFAAQLQTDHPDENVCSDEERASGSFLGEGCKSMDRVFAWAAASGLDCSTPQQLSTVLNEETSDTTGCGRAVDIVRDYGRLFDHGSIATYLVILMFIITAFPFSTFTHRSSRNLRTMKAQGQKHSPDGAVTRFFIPVMNLYKPIQIFIELFKASDPNVPQDDGEAWKKQGRISPIAVIWGLLWPAALIFNPVFVSRIWFGGGRENLADAEQTMSALIISDIILICLGIAAILMSNTLSAWQDARAAKYGTVTVVPPRPRDPMEKALEEGIKRRDTPRKSKR